MYGAGMLVFVLQIEEIGGKFVDPPTFDIAKSYADSALLLQKVLNQAWAEARNSMMKLYCRSLCREDMGRRRTSCATMGPSD